MYSPSTLLPLEYQQFVSFLHKHRGFAFRTRLQLTDVDREDGQRVPFYLMPYLGGHRTLRGYEEFRFRGENLLLFNAEYRWKAWTSLDMALFLDMGDVFREPGDINLAHLKTSYGIGFRVLTGRSVLLQLDLGWHRWGAPRLQFSFGKVF